MTHSQKKEIRELLLVIVCLMNSSTENDQVCEVMSIIEKKTGSSLPKWKKVFGKGNMRKEFIKELKARLKNL